MQGGVIDAASASPGVIANSNGEAEYCAAALALQAGTFHKKVFNEVLGRDIDRNLTIPIGIDSKAAIDIANSSRETKKTRHIARRYHYFRWSVATGAFIPISIPGDRNPANSLTKVLNKDDLKKETRFYQVEVDP